MSMRSARPAVSAKSSLAIVVLVDAEIFTDAVEDDDGIVNRKAEDCENSGDEKRVETCAPVKRERSA